MYFTNRINLYDSANSLPLLVGAALGGRALRRGAGVGVARRLRGRRDARRALRPARLHAHAPPARARPAARRAARAAPAGPRAAAG